MKRLVMLTTLCSALLLIGNVLSSSQAAGDPKPANGAAIYNQHCVKCHGAGGKGVENFTPDLSKAANKRSWLNIINNGKDTMPGFKDSLSPAQVKAVLSHINSFGRSGKKK
ncbi:MAG TPA: cytochrome c [Blastocatellia bacterium]|nr:cytochrome c [Blastocatellia bacterium]